MFELDAARVHLVDAYPLEQPRNFLFRGNNPAKNGTFEYANLTALLRSAARRCGATLPEDYDLVDLDLENAADPGYQAELDFFKTHPSVGRALKWPTFGSLLPVKHTPDAEQLAASGKWAIVGGADHLPERLNTTVAMLRNVSSSRPTVMYVHCNAGCDRTGEFVASYAMAFRKWNITTAYGEACRQCGRCPNYFASNSIGWMCLAMQQAGVPGLGDCKDAFGCKFAGACDAHVPTPLADACPALSERRASAE